MTLSGECVNDTQTVCIECGAELNIQVCPVPPAITSDSFVLGVALTAVRAVITATARKLNWPLSRGLFGR